MGYVLLLLCAVVWILFGSNTCCLVPNYLRGSRPGTKSVRCGYSPILSWTSRFLFVAPTEQKMLLIKPIILSLPRVNLDARVKSFEFSRVTWFKLSGRLYHPAPTFFSGSLIPAFIPGPKRVKEEYFAWLAREALKPTNWSSATPLLVSADGPKGEVSAS